MNGHLPASSRSCWINVGLASFVGLLLRLDLNRRLGLNQFDEGIYAFAARWAFDRHGLAGIDPGLIPYAPCGYPILVGLMSLLCGSSDQPSFFVSALAGTATIAAVAVLAANLFGEQAAVVSAWCVCCSGPHIAFSRSGLTDASFLLVWALGWIASLRFLDRPTWWSASMMGLLVGLAQHCKYNGWLLGGLVLATALTFALRPPPGQPKLFYRLISRGALGAIVAGIVVAPWYFFVEKHGGYAGLLTHQRNYLGGLTTWWPHLRNQADQAVAMSGPFWLILLGVLAIGISQAKFGLAGPARTHGGLVAPWLMAGPMSLLLIAAPVTSFLLFMAMESRGSTVGRRFIIVGGTVLLILTPFYHPYARLWLPFEMAHWLAIGRVISQIAEDGPVAHVIPPWLRRTGPSFVSGGCVLLFVTWGPGFPLSTPGRIDRSGLFAPSDSLHVLADRLSGRLPPDVTEIRTLVRPALTYYLAGRLPARSQSNLGMLLEEPRIGSWALIDSTILDAGQGRDVSRGLEGDRMSPFRSWELVARFEAVNSLITTLDLDPSAVSAQGGCTKAEFWLLRSRSKGSSE